MRKWLAYAEVILCCAVLSGCALQKKEEVTEPTTVSAQELLEGSVTTKAADGATIRCVLKSVVDIEGLEADNNKSYKKKIKDASKYQKQLYGLKWKNQGEEAYKDMEAYKLETTLSGEQLMKLLDKYLPGIQLAADLTGTEIPVTLYLNKSTKDPIICIYDLSQAADSTRNAYAEYQGYRYDFKNYYVSVTF